MYVIAPLSAKRQNKLDQIINHSIYGNYILFIFLPFGTDFCEEIKISLKHLTSIRDVSYRFTIVRVTLIF